MDTQTKAKTSASSARTPAVYVVILEKPLKPRLVRFSRKMVRGALHRDSKTRAWKHEQVPCYQAPATFRDASRARPHRLPINVLKNVWRPCRTLWGVWGCSETYQALSAIVFEDKKTAQMLLASLRLMAGEVQKSLGVQEEV